MLKPRQIFAAFMLMLSAGVAISAPATRAPFDHLTTGFELEGKHREATCESCHVNAVFKGTSRDCAA